MNARVAAAAGFAVAAAGFAVAVAADAAMAAGVATRTRITFAI
jgi:hypothetical protein